MGSGITRLCDGDISWLLWGEVGGEVGGVGTVGLVCVSRLLRMRGTPSLPTELGFLSLHVLPPIGDWERSRQKS